MSAIEVVKEDLEDSTTEEERQSEASPNKSLFRSNLHRVLFIIVICATQLITQATFAQSVVIAFEIGHSFNETDPGELSWFAAAYSLTVGTFILPAGKLGDIYGHKKMLIISWIWYSLSSVLAGLSVYTHSVPFFDICRALQGIGGALMMPNALAVLGRTFEAGKFKNMIFGLFAACAPNGFVVGALISASFASYVTWEWAYYIAAMATAVLALAAQWIIPDQYQKPDHKFDDYLGAITGVTGLVLFNFAWNQGPIVGWDTPYVYSLLIVGVFFIVLFVSVERFFSKHPLLPLSTFTLEINIMLSCVALGWASFGIWIWFLVQFLEVARGIPTMLVAVMFLPVCFSGTTASLLAGFLISKFHASLIMLFSLIAFCVGNILVATQPVDQTYWAQTFVCLLIMPFGMDMNFTSATVLLSNSMPREHQGIAGSLISTVVNYSISIGLGVAGTVVAYASNDPSSLFSFRVAWYTSIAFSGLGILVALFYLSYTVKQKNHVFA